jgi:hypothetical protein
MSKQEQEPTYHDIDPNQPQQETFDKNRVSGFDILPTLNLPERDMITPEYLEAVLEIQTGVVSPKYIQKKQSLSYISHVHATETMNTVFNTDWDYQVLGYEVFEDGSALVRAQMQVVFQNHVRRFVEVGSHDGYRLKNDAGDMQWDIANYGAFLYDKEPNPPITPNAVWGNLIILGDMIGVDQDTQAEALKKGGITKGNLIDSTHEAVNIVYAQL